MRSTSKWGIRYPTLDDSNDPIAEEYTAEDTEKSLNLMMGVYAVAVSDGTMRSIGNTVTDNPIGVWGELKIGGGSGLTISAGGIHIGLPGHYEVSGSVSFDTTADGVGRRGMWPTVNGVGVPAQFRVIVRAAPGGTSVAMRTQTLFDLEAGDTISAIPYNGSGQTVNYYFASLSLRRICW